MSTHPTKQVTPTHSAPSSPVISTPAAPALDPAEKRKRIDEFWTERAIRYGSDPRTNSLDVHLGSLELRYAQRILNLHKPESVLDFGCANGHSTLQLAEGSPSAQFIGIDINSQMISLAKEAARASGLSNVTFEHRDILLHPLEQHVDCIVAVRAFQHVESSAMQRRLADALMERLTPGGVFLIIESYQSGHDQLNSDRGTLGLPPLPVPDHMTLLTAEFDAHVSRRMILIKREAPAASYTMITRLVYASMATSAGEVIDADHPLHELAAQVPQVGTYGPLIATVYTKPTCIGESVCR